MANAKHTKRKHPSQTATEFAIESIDAYCLAQEAVGDLSAIFQALDNLELAGNCDLRIARIMFRAGLQNATYWLNLLEERMDGANNALKQLEKIRLQQN